MKLKTSILFFLCYCCGLLLLLSTSCKKDKAASSCGPVTIIYATTASDSCVEKGTIVIHSPIGPGYRYSIGSQPFRSSPSFQSLLPGAYNLIVKTSEGCVDSIRVSIMQASQGPLFTVAKDVFVSYCFPCHTGSNPQAGHDWGRNCDILNKWDRIKARAVEGNPASMPPAGLIPQAERDKIMNWINAGHRITD